MVADSWVTRWKYAIFPCATHLSEDRMITLLSLVIATAEATDIYVCKDQHFGRYIHPKVQMGIGLMNTAGGANGMLLPPPGYEGEWMEYEPHTDAALMVAVRVNNYCEEFTQYALSGGISSAGFGGRIEAGKSMILEGFIELGYSVGIATHYDPYHKELESVIDLSLPLTVVAGKQGNVRFGIYPMVGVGIHVEPAHGTEKTLTIPASRSGVRMAMYWLR